MSISWDEFERGEQIKPIEQVVLEFLSKNRRSPYTTAQILEEVRRSLPRDPDTFVIMALESLLTKKAVLGKLVKLDNGEITEAYAVP